MVARSWRVRVSQLSGAAPLADVEVEASNWMGALKAARLQLGEDGSVPSGASCAVAPDGTVTVLDAGSRRRFTLSPHEGADSPAPVAAPAQPENAGGRGGRSKALQTVSTVPQGPAATGSRAVAAGVANTAAASAARPAGRAKRKFETVAFNVDQVSVAEKQIVINDRPPEEQPEPPPPTAAFDRIELELLLHRDEDPSPDNPLVYRERVYVVPPQTRAADAEAALRFQLDTIMGELGDFPKGKFINLAVFDHHWDDQPQRPPLVVLEWKDWRGAPQVDYPAVELSRTPIRAEGPSNGADRLAVAFEELQDLTHLESASSALQKVVKLLDNILPSDAVSAYLYDIDTDELRFVAASGEGASEQQGTAVPSQAGLLGQAMRRDGESFLVGDVLVEPAFNPNTDTRASVEARNMLLRSVVAGGRPLGLLQLINRRDATGFTRDDMNVMNYIADRLAEGLLDLKHRPSI